MDVCITLHRHVQLGTGKVIFTLKVLVVSVTFVVTGGKSVLKLFSETDLKTVPLSETQQRKQTQQ